MPVPTMILGLSNKQHSTAEGKSKERDFPLWHRQAEADESTECRTQENLPVLQGLF